MGAVAANFTHRPRKVFSRCALLISERFHFHVRRHPLCNSHAGRRATDRTGPRQRGARPGARVARTEPAHRARPAHRDPRPERLRQVLVHQTDHTRAVSARTRRRSGAGAGAGTEPLAGGPAAQPAGHRQRRPQRQSRRHAWAGRGERGAVRLLRQLRGAAASRGERRDARPRTRGAAAGACLAAAAAAVCGAVGRRDPARADRARWSTGRRRCCWTNPAPGWT